MLIAVTAHSRNRTRFSQLTAMLPVRSATVLTMVIINAMAPPPAMTLATSRQRISPASDNNSRTNFILEPPTDHHKVPDAMGEVVVLTATVTTFPTRPSTGRQAAPLRFPSSVARQDAARRPAAR